MKKTKLSGVYFQKAQAYLEQELSNLEEQRGICREADVLYQKVRLAYQQFEKTSILADALRCARIRG